MELYIWIYLLASVMWAVSGSECQFPEEWRGRWHEGRRTDISINSMSHKGTCIEREGNKYFMLNKDSNNRKCFKCLVFIQWHPNLLQYKESPCWYEESFHHVCNLINGDALLHTLVKATSSPQPCPFQGSYTFSYINGTMSNLPCESPISEVRACADESKFKFAYKRCNGIPGTYDKEVDFQCMATWENGEKYLYGSFSEPWMTRVEDYMYRCFMHSFYGTHGDMSMSADATCQGLQSPTLGSISLKFTKDLNQPRGTCRFTDILVSRNKWRDFSGAWFLEVEAGLQVLRLKSRKTGDVIKYAEVASALDTSTTKLVIKCVQNTYTAQTKTANVLQTDYITYVTDDECKSGYQCVRLIKRDTNILEMYLGDRFNGTVASCTDANFENAKKDLLIPDVNDAGQCSITRKGVYTYQDKASECTGTVNIGCATPNKITIDTRCPNQRRAVASTHTEKVEILDCLYSWTSGSKTFIIIQNGEQRAKCLTFIDTEIGVVELQSDDSCQSDRWTVSNQYINYVLYSPPDACGGSEIQADQNTSYEKPDVEKHSDTISRAVGLNAGHLATIFTSILLLVMFRVR